MIFEFAKYTEITAQYLKLRPELKDSGYIRFFICPDVNDAHLVRVLKDTNENYETEEGVYLLEFENIPNKRKGEDINLIKLNKIITKDELENWDIKEYQDLSDLIEDLDSGFGINNLLSEEELENILTNV